MVNITHEYLFQKFVPKSSSPVLYLKFQINYDSNWTQTWTHFIDPGEFEVSLWMFIILSIVRRNNYSTLWVLITVIILNPVHCYIVQDKTRSKRIKTIYIVLNRVSWLNWKWMKKNILGCPTHKMIARISFIATCWINPQCRPIKRNFRN